MYKKLVALTIVVAGVLLVATPAKAFYLELPNVLKFWMGTTRAQEAPAQVIAPAPVVEPQPQSQPQPVLQPQPVSMQTTEMQPAQTCRVNGVEMPGSCDQYNNNQPNNYQPMQGGGESGQMGGQMDEAMQMQDQERQLKDMRRGVKDMTRSLKEFERMMNSMEKKGTTISQETKDKLQRAKEMLDVANKATTAEEMGDMSELNDTVRELEDTRREVFESAQRLDGIKRGIKGMNTGLKQFERQVAKLTKQGVVVSTDVSETLSKIKTLVDVVNKAKTYEEAEEAGVEDIWDLMQSLEERRQDLEMMARWPQTVKQLDRELKKLERQLKNDRRNVDRLAKQGIDLNHMYENFAAAIDKLKTTKAEAVAKMAEGNSQDAFDLVENDFFGQMDDVWQNDRIIQTMSNLGRFKSEFKQRLAEAKRLIKQIERQKKDASEIKELLAQLEEKGNEVLEMIKSKDFDEESVMAILDEMENIGQEFESAIEELLGKAQIMPWEQGQQQFKQVKMDPNMTRYIPQKREAQEVKPQPNEMVGESNPSPAP